jgi:hypothetical protein
VSCVPAPRVNVSELLAFRRAGGGRLFGCGQVARPDQPHHCYRRYDIPYGAQRVALHRTGQIAKRSFRVGVARQQEVDRPSEEPHHLVDRPPCNSGCREKVAGKHEAQLSVRRRQRAVMSEA